MTNFLPPLSREGLDDLTDYSALVVTELIANAAEHTASGLVRVSITLPDKQRVRIIVTDTSRTLPVPKKADADDEHGRGLALLDAVTQRWGAKATSKGKRVWGELKSEAAV
ncbi:ATP-binding protein [Streptomyces polygonati]|uniref:ATP-binding protein n=1 Tax=Streptomyces polygonati TaxID=1617087 RepID=A0ABV8HUK2_9ACTN